MITSERHSIFAAITTCTLYSRMLVSRLEIAILYPTSNRQSALPPVPPPRLPVKMVRLKKSGFTFTSRATENMSPPMLHLARAAPATPNTLLNNVIGLFQEHSMSLFRDSVILNTIYLLSTAKLKDFYLCWEEHNGLAGDLVPYSVLFVFEDHI